MIIEKITLIWNAIKKISAGLIVAAIGALIALLAISYHNNSELKEQLSNAAANNKAYQEQLSSEQSKVREFVMSMDMLRQNNDSITAKLLEAQHELKIKDKNIEHLSYMLTNFRSDTFYITSIDTLFLDPELCIDTIIGDKWMNIWLKLQYPNTIQASSEALSEKEVIISSKRETINPPKKFFLWRWFQKKHTVTEVHIVEENPYINSQQNVFYKITK